MKTTVSIENSSSCKDKKNNLFINETLEDSIGADTLFIKAEDID